MYILSRRSAVAALRCLPLLTLCLGLLAAGCGSGNGVVAEDNQGAVYTQTNATAGNAIVAFTRAADGTLTPAFQVPTGGLGTSSNLGNQGAVALSSDRRWLFAVDAGSDQISVFAVALNRLTLIGTAPSGGDQPVSLTVHDNLLYVLNAGGAGNITGFTIGGDGSLSPLSNSTRPLSGSATGPAQVSFSPAGDLLAVTEKATRQIDTYVVGSDGRPTGPSVHASSGVTPFGFDFDRRGRLVVSEASGFVSSYAVSSAGALSPISASVPTNQRAACWLEVTGDGKYAYAANAGSASITGFRINDDGSLTPLNADGITVATGGATPVDIALSPNSRYLYALLRGSGTVAAFAVGSDGSLTPLGSVAGVPMGTTTGLAAW